MKVFLDAQIKKVEAEAAQLRQRATSIQSQIENANNVLGSIVRELAMKEGGLNELRKVQEELNANTESDCAD